MSSFWKKVGHVAHDVGHVAGKAARAALKSPIGQAADFGLSFVPGGNLVSAGVNAAAGNYGSAALSLVPMGGALGKVGKMGVGTIATKVGKAVWANKGKIAAAAGIGLAGKAASSVFSGGGAPTALPPMPMYAGSDEAAGAMGNQHNGPNTGLSRYIPFWKGPGGHLQMPWNDPSAPEALKNFALDDSWLRQTVRAPKGYVVIRDSDGRPLPVLKWAARKYGFWKPHRKPPISAGEWHGIQKAHRTVKKMHKIFRMTTTVEKNVKHGKVVVHKHKRG